MKRKKDAVTFLVDRGANIHLKNKQNLSPKMLAEVIKFHHAAFDGGQQGGGDPQPSPELIPQESSPI